MHTYRGSLLLAAPRAEFEAAAQGLAHMRAGAARIRTLRGMPGYVLVKVPRGFSPISGHSL